MKQSAFGICVCLIFACSCARANNEVKAKQSRTIDFEYIVHVPALRAPGHDMHIWIPLPPSSAHQKVSHLRIDGPISYHIDGDSKYGNRYAYFDVSSTYLHPFDIKVSFDVRREAYRISTSLSDVAAVGQPNRSVESYLQPDRLVPIDGIISEISQEQTKGISGTVAKARAIYQYVIRTMHYDHAGTGWGRGDAIWACSSHHGNCTDFHSLFIGLARAAGIPARFDIGFPLPLDEHEGKISSYHCWAEFYVQDVGWIPIDAAEAWQDPSKHDYFFGALDDNRVRFTRGRDLILDPRQNGGTLNYFIYPYAELDGKPFPDLHAEFYFKDLQVADGRGAKTSVATGRNK